MSPQELGKRGVLCPERWTLVLLNQSTVPMKKTSRHEPRPAHKLSSLAAIDKNVLFPIQNPNLKKTLPEIFYHVQELAPVRIFSSPASSACHLDSFSRTPREGFVFYFYENLS